jgi:polysaccharide export outer membrane protein
MRSNFFFAAVTVCFFLTGCATSEEVIPKKKIVAEPETYKIGAEDVLEVAVWQNPDVSRTVTVRPDGNISLPLVDDVRAIGLSPEELKRTIKTRLKPFMTSEPEVSVIVLQVNSKKFYVQGEVINPGTFPMRNRTTVSQAITLAGGFTEFAKKNKIRILRKWQGKPETIKVKYKKILKDETGTEDVLLRPDDVVIVP